MEPEMIKLAVNWGALMLVYLLGDILRAYEKGTAAAVIDGQPMDSKMFVYAALMMLLPILMLILSVELRKPLGPWMHLIVSVLLFAINAFGLRSYEAAYDRMLILVSLLINVWIAISAVRWGFAS